MTSHTNERWKDVLGYEGLYQISDQGRVLSMERKVKGKFGQRINRERILSPGKSSSGYFTVVLCRGSFHTSKQIHRLVAEHYIENPLGKKDVNHKDGIKSNCVYTNLEWATRSENIQHAYDTGLLKPYQRKPKITALERK